MSLVDARDFLQELKLDKKERVVGEKLLHEILGRLQFLIQLGLDYLTLDRSAMTLSGGEAQRVRLATQLGSSLAGVLYILDEPSIGLHQKDNAELLRLLKQLRDAGNSVVVVEHDQETIAAAEHIIDIGPGAGLKGGEIVAQGTLAEIMENERSLTGQYLSGRMKMPVPAGRRTGTGELLDHQRSEREQSERHHRADTGGLDDLCHRSLRVRQVEPGHGYSLQCDCPTFTQVNPQSRSI